jgi:tetratricopeptide (TPR) repeat protein
MKNFLSLFFAISLTLSACGTASTQPAQPAQTGTPTIKPLPTIPTFTPTFDVSTIVTVTPAEKAKCPKEDPSVVAEFATPHSSGVYDILDYLRSEGISDQLEKNPQFTIMELTGDDESEVGVYGIWRYDILGCNNGKYEDLLEFEPNGVFTIQLKDILDLNKNGLPELIFYNFDHYGSAEVYIFEWDGNTFRSLIDLGLDDSSGTVIDSAFTTTNYKIRDTNGDGTREIILEHDLKTLKEVSGLTLWLWIPFRKETTTLGWNGKNYVNLKPGNFESPEYRFQEIQDGDRQTSYGNYTSALSFYQEAINNDDLEWWSYERNDYEIFVFNSRFDTNPVLPPTPNPDPAEYPRLAAYAYYRILLLHLVQGQEAEAESTYQTLQDTFGIDPYAAPYVEMATAFWEAYQSTQKMYDGCAAAIQYAVEHPQILTPLGSDYHGSQSHTYVPADVCPFR